MPKVSLSVNGRPISAEVEGRTLLVQLLREKLGLTGTHVGCDTSQCGACVVDIDGRSVKSCTILAVQAEGARRQVAAPPAGRAAGTTSPRSDRRDVRRARFTRPLRNSSRP